MEGFVESSVGINAGLEVDAHTAVTRWQGGRMDYDLAVGAMLSSKEFVAHSHRLG